MTNGIPAHLRSVDSRFKGAIHMLQRARARALSIRPSPLPRLSELSRSSHGPGETEHRGQQDDASRLMSGGEGNGNEVEQRGDTHRDLQNGGGRGGLGPCHGRWWKETSERRSGGEQGKRQNGGKGGYCLTNMKRNASLASVSSGICQATHKCTMIKLDSRRVFKHVSPPLVALVRSLGVPGIHHFISWWHQATAHRRELVVDETCIKTCHKGTCGTMEDESVVRRHGRTLQKSPINYLKSR